METIHTVEWMKQVTRAARAAGRMVGFVPTMGALHEGHLSLIRAAKQQCNPVVVSIFVNPAQFGPKEDFTHYPRPVGADKSKLEELGVDYMFMPQAREIYPDGFRTWILVEGFSDQFEGRSRPGHFRGVATIVLKLLEIVQPQYAYVGRKDAQQARILQQMASDLNLDAQIEVCPIVREANGLALSSRNAYLRGSDREAAQILYQSLLAAEKKIKEGERDAAGLVQAIRKVLGTEAAGVPDYVEIVDARTFEPVHTLHGNCLALLAVNVGGVRLLDNMLIEEQEGKYRTSL
ncbi:MAG: pantoate--beta-alanine ligase [Acidobacteria bacterium]|nr:pantoate--beta-alanine ligase [Acidobacteriota bacterium]